MLMNRVCNVCHTYVCRRRVIVPEIGGGLARQLPRFVVREMTHEVGGEQWVQQVRESAKRRVTEMRHLRIVDDRKTVMIVEGGLAKAGGGLQAVAARRLQQAGDREAADRFHREIDRTIDNVRRSR